MESNRKGHVTEDVFGRKVRITKERLNHILTMHPEMKKGETMTDAVTTDTSPLSKSI